MLPRVVSVQVLPNFRLGLAFGNGEHRQFDMTPYLDYTVFNPLRNPGFFGLARVEYGTVTWPGEIDIAPETLYMDSVPEPVAGEIEA